MEKTTQFPFNYDYTDYEDIIVGKCREISSIIAQGKTREEVCNILRRMTEQYIIITKSLNPKT